jgi:hypothetical protein
MRLAISPFIAPMEIKYLKSIFARRRSGVALPFLLCLSLLALPSSFAQLKTRRVTGMQLGPAAEGSRVTMLADAPLNDYEAFRRGDRFYVKIPLADFMTGLPQFRADGFEGVQVQKAGDSLIVSFKLQPGATARINQYGNRLDVVFSAPNRSSQNATAGSGTPGTARQTSSDRGSDTAGPVPPGSSASSERIVSDSSGSIDQGTSSFNPRFGNGRRPNATRSGNNSTVGNNAVGAASPIPSPSTTFSPAQYSNYPPLTTATPVSSSQVGSRSGSSNSNSRSAVMRWMSANRLATLLGALILLSLILYLATAIRRRKKDAVKGAGAKAKVQPKYSPTERLDELPSTRANEPLPPQQSAAEQPMLSASAAAASAQDQPWVLTKPTIVSPTAAPPASAAPSAHDTDQEEREVFEL